MQDRTPTPGQEGRVLITPETGSPYYAEIEMADNPTQVGTPLNKATLLKDATAVLYGLGTDAVPDDVLEKLSNAVLIGSNNSLQNAAGNNIVIPSAQLDSSVKIETGLYTGTGTYGQNNPNRLTFKGKPIVVFIVDHNDPSSNHLMRVWMFPCFAYNRNNNEYDDPGYFNIAESFGNGEGQPEYIFAKVSGTTLMWYGEDSAWDQINQSTYRYYYFALTSLGGAST